MKFERNICSKSFIQFEYKMRTRVEREQIGEILEIFKIDP